MSYKRGTIIKRGKGVQPTVAIKLPKSPFPAKSRLFGFRRLVGVSYDFGGERLEYWD
jgi:hypothetical protein